MTSLPSIPLPSIPLAPADIPPEWLTAALRGQGLDVPAVTRVTAELMQSLTAIMHRLHIEYAGPTALPRTLIWKHSTADPAVRAAFGHFNGRSGYEREVHFYREVAPTIGTRVPRCFLARYDPATDDHVLLLEDLAPTHHPGDLRTPMRPAEAAACLDELALLHASAWGVPPPTDPAAFERNYEFFRDSLAEHRPFLAAVLDSETLAQLDAYGDVFLPWALRLNARPQTLIHSDTHPGNLLFPETEHGRVVLVDWQGWRTGPAARDLGRTLVLMLSTDDRRRAEQSLVVGYCAALRADGVHYDEDLAFDDYRIGAANQWFWAVTFVRRRHVWDDATRVAMPGLIRRAAAAALDTLAARPALP